MYFDTVDFNKLSYSYNKIKYGHKTFKFETPYLECVSNIENDYGKYIVKFKLNTDDDNNVNFFNFMKILENRHKMVYDSDNYKYKCQLSNEILTLKLLNRNDKLEIKCRGDIDSIYNIKIGEKYKLNIYNSNIWKFVTSNSKKVSGSVMYLDTIIK